MALPIYPICHDIPPEYGLHGGYDFIRQTPCVQTEIKVFDVPDPTKVEAGGVFQVFKNRQYDSSMNESLLEDRIQTVMHTQDRMNMERIAYSARHYWSTIMQQDPWIPANIIHQETMRDTAAVVERISAPQLGTVASFRWRDRIYVVSPSGPILNVVRVQELRPSFSSDKPTDMLRTIGIYDLKAPIEKIRAACAFFADSDSPLIAIQASTQELAILRLRPWKSGTFGAEASLIECLAFKSPLTTFAWDERHSLVRDTRSLCVLTSDGAIYNWQGKDKLRILRGAEYAADLCEGTNFGSAILFGGHPSTLLVMTNRTIDKIDFTTSSTTQERLVTFWRDANRLDRQVELRSEARAEIAVYGKRITKRKQPVAPEVKLEDDDEQVQIEPGFDFDVLDEEMAFRSTAQIMMEAEQSNVVSSVRLRGPVQQQFNLEWERTKKKMPSYRMMPDEALRDAVQHPSYPFRFAVLTTMRVLLFDERKPRQPLAQWRHHLVHNRQHFPRHILPYYRECPQTVQFVLPPMHLAEAPTLAGKFFVLVTSALSAELFTFDDGPQDTSTIPPLDEKKIQPSEFIPLPTSTEQKSAMDSDILALMDTIVRDLTKPTAAPTPMPPTTSHMFSFSLPLPAAPRQLGVPQKLFSEATPLREDFDRLRTEHMRRIMNYEKLIIGITANIGTWKFNQPNGDELPTAVFGVLALKADHRGSIHAQMHPIAITDEDIAFLNEHEFPNPGNGAGSDSESGSASDSDSSSSSSPSGSSQSSGESSSQSYPVNLPRRNLAKRKRPPVAEAGSSSSSESELKSDTETSDSDVDADENDPEGRFDVLLEVEDKDPDDPADPRPRAASYMTKPLPLVAVKQIQPYDILDATDIAEAAYDTGSPVFAAPVSFPPEVEEARMKSIQECEGDFTKLRKVFAFHSPWERIQLQILRKRLNPYTNELDPVVVEGPLPTESSQAGTALYSSSTLMEGVEDMVKSGKGALYLPLHPERGALTEAQFNFLVENIEPVLSSLKADTPPTNIDLAGVFDVIPTDLGAVERILCRVRLELFSRPALTHPRSTSEIYRSLVEKDLIHPFYFPVGLLRLILAFYVNGTVIDYIPLRQTGGTLYGVSATGNLEEQVPSTRLALGADDATFYNLTTFDELDMFIPNRTGLEDVDLSYLIGKVNEPATRPTPGLATQEMPEPWRAPRFAYPPDEAPIGEQATQSLSMMLATQQTLQRVPTASQLNAKKISDMKVNMDLATQQSQIMELFQTQQSIPAPTEVDVAMEGRIPREILQAPGTERQLYGQLLHKWGKSYTDPEVAVKARATIFTPSMASSSAAPASLSSQPSLLTQSLGLMRPSQSFSMDL